MISSIKYQFCLGSHYFCEETLLNWLHALLHQRHLQQMQKGFYSRQSNVKMAWTVNITTDGPHSKKVQVLTSTEKTCFSYSRLSHTSVWMARFNCCNLRQQNNKNEQDKHLHYKSSVQTAKTEGTIQSTQSVTLLESRDIDKFSETCLTMHANTVE